MKQQSTLVFVGILGVAMLMGCTGPEVDGDGGDQDVSLTFPTQDTTDSSDTVAPDVACVSSTCESLGTLCGAPDDGCGAVLACGDCQAPLACGVDFRCECNPICADEICGNKDSCGGTCELGSGYCMNGCDEDGAVQCLDGGVQTCGQTDPDSCLDWSEAVVCDSGACVDGSCCDPVCDGVVCGEADGCGGLCEEGSGCCAPACGDKECGDDGCGGDCGTCPVAAPNCDPDGTCQADCISGCGDKECGDDGCGLSCGTCPAVAPTCNAGTCEADCISGCGDKECGDDGCGLSCGTCPAVAPTCNAGTCEADCTPDCAGKECGDDGCGLSCGTCPAAAPTCNAGLCEADCTPDCAGKECGDDGCEGDCGPCPAAAPDCNAFGICVANCIPDCMDVKCGDLDGCGGTCQSGSGCCTNVCVQGETACENADWVLTCGNYDPDPCTEWSGPEPCPGTGSCVNGSCEETPPVGCTYPMAPVDIIAGLAATGSGVCSTDNILLDDGQAAEFWSSGDGVNDWLAVDVTVCQVVDFGQACTPNEICVEAWAGEGGCSGDTCGGACESCKGALKTSLDVFAYETNSTLNFQYKFSMNVGATGNPGDVMCYSAGDDPIQFVMVCRAGCLTPSSSYNAFVDYVYLQ